MSIFLTMILTATVVGPALLECGTPRTSPLFDGFELFYSGGPLGECISSNIGWGPGMPLNPVGAFAASLILVAVCRIALGRLGGVRATRTG
jgi:hypothetical protein